MIKLSQVLPFLFLLGGCPSSALEGLTPVRVESKRSTPIQRCKATSEFRALIDQAVPVILNELHKAGLLDRDKVIKSLRKENPIACMIEQPEPCSFSPETCTANHPACARKRGCGHYAGFWVAEYWPPVCRDKWPDEPHCVQSAKEQTREGFVRDTIHEACEMLCARTLPYCDCHDKPALDVQAKALTAFNRTSSD